MRFQGHSQKKKSLEKLMLIGFMLSRNETEQPQHLNASRVLISCESTSIMNSTDA